jgi:hypothetical protein
MRRPRWLPIAVLAAAMAGVAAGTWLFRVVASGS